jgi:hypothetical protein
LNPYEWQSPHKSDDDGQEIPKKVDESKKLDENSKKWPFEKDESNTHKEAASPPQLFPS